MKKNANKGFSLVELIIVIAIMAVLIGVLAPQFIKQVEKSRESTDLQNVEEMKTAVEIYVAEKGDSLTGDTITVSLAKAPGNISCSDTGVGEYGVTAQKTKSKNWTDFTWTYYLKDTTSNKAYTWGVDNTTGATYYDVNGTTK